MDFLSPGVQTVIRMGSVFPSALDGDGSVEGGLVLLRMRPRSDLVEAGIVRLVLSYSVQGVPFSSCQDISMAAPSPDDVALCMDLAIQKGVLLQRYVEVCKTYLSSACQSSAEKEAAMHGVEELMSALDKSPEDADAMCSGIKQELQQFTTIARSHIQGSSTV